MSESIELFRIVMAGRNAEFTEEEMAARRARVRSEIMALIPATRNLISSTLVDYLVVDEQSRFCLKFCLVSSRQGQLFQHTEKTVARHPASDYGSMLAEFEAIRRSAEQSQIKIGELISTFSILTSGDTTEEIQAPGYLSTDDAELRKLMLSKRGKSIVLSFPDQDLYYQFPLLPHYLAESGSRIVRAIVKSLSKSRASLAVSEELSEVSCTSRTGPIPPGSYILHRTSLGFIDCHWNLLAVAVLTGGSIEAEVKVARHAQSGMPAYLEFRSLRNADKLIGEMKAILQDIRMGC